MSVDPQLASLAQRVGAFHITDREMKEAQRTIDASIAAGQVDPQARNRYLAAVQRYFSGFEREAHHHLRDLDRRLEHVHQVQFNLAAERSVAAKRIEATQAVLAQAQTVEHDPQ